MEKNGVGSGSSWSLTSVSPLLKRQKKLSDSTSSLPSDSTKTDINTRDKKGRTNLFYAARKGNIQEVKKFLEAGGDVNRADNFGMTPLHEATENSQTDVLELLIKYGCDLNAKNILGQTSLMRAVLYDDLDTVRVLTKAGSALDERDCTGKTALMIGIQENRLEVISYLLHTGSNVHLQDKLGQTALYIAMRETKRPSAEVIRKLLKAGYDCNRDSHWLKPQEQEFVEQLVSESHQHSGILHKLASKIKHHHHKNSNDGHK